VIVDIELNGRRRAVDVRRDGDRWVLRVDDRTHVVHVAEIDGRWSLLVRGDRDATDPSASGMDAWRSHEVSFEGDGADLTVHVDGEPVRLAIHDARAGGWRRAHEHAAGDGPAAIVAPMPGRVVKVLVKPGETVAARQGVIVVEAMKMENELRTPRAGTVAEVRVSEGMSVESNAVLVTLA